MNKKYELVKNAAGRMVPTEVNGKPQVPFQGVDGYKPEGRKAAPPISSCTDYPSDGNKVVGSIKEALELAGLKDGMTISSHHHFRNGDLVMNQVFDAAEEMGTKGLMW
ncbi:MAG: citrate lyase subunit alpha, partial [Candidatus Marinimicrobia bacterium]|nr:citrate lyase subunit alpha [Candidatus Neomarinimicrobiota bacterium]